MKTPFLLLGAALLLWGWLIDALWLAVPMALLLEGSRWIRARFEFAQTDLDRIWTLCILLFAGSAVALFALNDGFDAVGGVARGSPAERLETFNRGANSALRFLQFMPATLLPIVLAQAFAQQERFPASTFSSWLRRRRRQARPSSQPAATLNVSYPFLAVVFFSAALSKGQGWGFLPGFSILLGWALWHHRPVTFRPAAWITAVLAALALGLASMFLLLQVQKVLHRLDGALMAQLGGGKGFDPRGTRTRLGTIGGLQNSGRIVLRLETPAGAPPPLLREATYDVFRSPFWTSSQRHFERTLPDAIDSSWPLLSGVKPTSTVTLSTYLDGGKGLLPLPAGSVRLSELPVYLLQTNSHGTVQVEEGPGFVRFQAHFQDQRSLDSAPQPGDLHLPTEEADVLTKVATSLNLNAEQPAQTAGRLRSHFANHFQYATWRGLAHRATTNRTALAGFLLDHRAGHCEYFATATTLLLRAAGIPARYAVGYAVQEKKGDFHVVRERHAHAWALAWIDGRWQDLDTTPGTWMSQQKDQAPFWEPIRDALSRAWYEFSKWRWGPTDWKRHLLWLLIPLVGLGGFRILNQKQWRRVRPSTPSPRLRAPQAGLDSELYLIEQELRAQGLGRLADETLARWLHRVQAQVGPAAERLEILVQIHYRLRFDPQGIPEAERLALRTEARDWLEGRRAAQRPSLKQKPSRPIS